MTSPSELRRLLLGVVTIGTVLLVYLFWNQPSSPVMVHVQSYTSSSLHKQDMVQRKADLRWTWVCERQTCIKKEALADSVHVSLKSCNMFCGSPQLWPQPTGPVSMRTRSVSFHLSSLQFETDAKEPAKSYIGYSFSVFKSNIGNLVPGILDEEPKGSKASYDLQRFAIKVAVDNSNEVRLRLSTNESYKLAVVMSNDKNELIATVSAANFFGARHGLETLSQLIWWDEFAASERMGGGSLRIVKGASVHDAPKFAYRGLMVDTARNFMPLENLKRVLVGMAANKLNAFHWHVSDSQSFPLHLPSVPKLAKYGAYRPDMVYTADQVKDLVEFAHLRGIRVLIEVDVPAHAGNGWTWGPEEGLGELAICVNVQPWTQYCGEPPCGQLNPDNPHVYDVLEKIYRDLIDLTGETEIFHIGGDEVNLECWSQYRNTSNKSMPTAYVDLNDVVGNFTVQLLDRLQKANKGRKPEHVVVWSSSLSKRPYNIKYLNRNEVIVQTWGGSEWQETPDLITDGYRIIVSHVDAWYLDCGFGSWREQGGPACDPYRTWQQFYRHRPWSVSELYKSMVVGGEACLWTEQVDFRSLDQRLWPRTAAFAERVWSDYVPNSTAPFSGMEDVYTRLETQRDRLISRGLSAEALWPQWCSQNPGMCL